MIRPYDWIIAGLALDVAGGLILAKGFMLKSVEPILRETRLHMGRNVYLVKSALHQRSEAPIGGALLALGFAAQLWGNFHGGPAANGWLNSAPRLALLLVVVGLAAAGALPLGHRWARETFRSYFLRAYKPDAEPSSGDDWDGLAWLYDTTRRRAENDDALRARLEQLRRTLGPRYAKDV